MRNRLLFTVLAVCSFVLAGTFLLAHPSVSLAQLPEESPDRRTVTGVELVGEVTFPTGFTVEGTEVGGLSGLAYDVDREVYYALADDPSQINPARFYSLTIDLADGTLEEGDIEFLGVTTLLNESGEPFPALGLDPEAIALTEADTLYVTSEGDVLATPPVDPWIREFDLSGQQLDELPVPEKFLPSGDMTAGIRHNLAFESLTLTPDGRYLVTATENALFQDGPAADLEQESLSRVLRYDLESGEPDAEWVYINDPVAEPPDPADAFRVNGLVELLALDNNGTYLALERSFSVGAGYVVKLYEIQSQGALEVQNEFDLYWEEGDTTYEIDPPVEKRLLVDFAELGVTPDNLEGLALGPELPDGRQSLIVAADNNFSLEQVTQFIALALELETIPVALAADETAQTVDDEDALAPLRGESDDPAIWVHPSDPAQSLVIATLNDGGLVVFDMDGEIVQTIIPAPYGEIRTNNVDLLYNFELGGEPVDLAVVSDRANDTLAVYRIDPESRQLVDVTADDMIESIFGVDDGERTAYGLATYTSPATGTRYAFVTQSSGNQIAQLELMANEAGEVSAEVVRVLELPVPTGNVEESQAEGVVVDQQLGVLYVAMEGEVGLLKASAEPGGGDEFTVIHSMDEPYLEPEIEGLAIYYGPGDEGYLLVSREGDDSYAVFERSGDNAYLGSFAIGGQGAIDQANESDGIDVLNVPLGPDYPFGLLVVQDDADDLQVVAPDDGELENISTNFKFVPWEAVANAFPEPLLIDTESYDPRDQQPTSVTLADLGAARPGTAGLGLGAVLILGLALGIGVASRRRSKEQGSA